MPSLALRTRPWLWILFFLVLGMALRYAWIFTAHPWETAETFRERYVYSDMLQYWNGAHGVWHPPEQWHPIDTLYPPGMAWYAALLLGPSMDRILLLETAQWALTVCIMLLSFRLAWTLFGRRAGIIALAVSAIAFPLFDYSAYVLAETPFTALIAAGSLAVVIGLRKQSRTLFAIAGICFGLSALFKSIGLPAGLAVSLCVFSPDFSALRRQRLLAAALFIAGMAVAITPASIAMTERNGGKFLLLANDVFRLGIANHGDTLGAEVHFPDGATYSVVSPVSLQKSFTEMRAVPWDSRSILRENALWSLEHPALALRQALERTADLLTGTVPFPTVGTQFRDLASISQTLTLLLIYLPACAFFLLALHRSWHAVSKLLPLLLPATAIFGTSLIAAMEPRYLHPFLPLLIALAAPLYFRLATVPGFLLRWLRQHSRKAQGLVESAHALLPLGHRQEA